MENLTHPKILFLTQQLLRRAPGIILSLSVLLCLPTRSVSARENDASAQTSEPVVSLSFTQTTEMFATPTNAHTSIEHPASPEEFADQASPLVAAVGMRALPHHAIKADPLHLLVIVDTSASQVGRYQQASVDIADRILATSPPSTKAGLATIDVDLKPLTPGIVPITDPSVNEALKDSLAATPLGNTNFPEGLLKAAALFDDETSSARRILYIGDGPGLSSADPDTFLRTLSKLRDRRIAFMAVGLGDRINWPCLAAVANATGGMVLTLDETSDVDGISASMQRMLCEPILWPDNTTVADLPLNLNDASENLLSSSVEGASSQASPMVLPPLRTDRDTVAFIASQTGLIRLSTVISDISGEQHNTRLDISLDAPSPDNAYIREVVRRASGTRGIFLPTLGRQGLLLAKNELRNEANTLARLGQQATKTNNWTAAYHLATASLRRDPDNPDAAHLQAATLTALTEAVNNSGELPPPDATEAAPLPGELNDDPGGLLEEDQRARRLVTQQLEQETAVRMRDARKLMATAPTDARDELKLLLQDIETAYPSSIDEATRTRLVRQVEMKVREADQRVAAFMEQRLANERRDAVARERQALLNDIHQTQDKLHGLSKRFEALIKEGLRQGREVPTTAFTEAERDVAVQFRDLTPPYPAEPNVSILPRTVAETMPLVARVLDYEAENMRLRRDSHRSFMDTLHLVDVAGIPFPDEPPILFPAADKWKTIDKLREKYKSVNLAKPGSAEEKIYSALEEPVRNFVYDNSPLTDFAVSLADTYGIPVEIDQRALDAMGFDAESIEITRSLSKISLRSALRITLSELDLAYIIKDEILLLTTRDEAEQTIIAKVYPVGDLVIPVNGNTAVNPGQLGGGMGGMGGMGGGMGGMGGGMGNGGGMMFQIADIVSRNQSHGTSSSPAHATEQSNLRIPASLLTAPDLRVAISNYLADRSDNQADSNATVGESSIDKRPSQHKLLAIKLTILQLGREGKHQQAADLLSALIAIGYTESWMYEALAIATEAAGASDEEVVRVLLSSADYATNATELLPLAEYLSATRRPEPCFNVCRTVLAFDPHNRRALALALGASEATDSIEQIGWTCAAILSHDWPSNISNIEQRAARLASATIRELETAGEEQAAFELRQRIDEALVRDIAVRVTWSGDADVDVLVQEPSGVVCSTLNPVSSSGAVLLGDQDTSHGDGEQEERYVCARALSGDYIVVIRKIWGDLAADSVSVEMVVRKGTHEEERISKVIPLQQREAVLTVNLPVGRRAEAVDDLRVEELVENQVTANRAYLAQQLNQLASPDAEYSLSQSRGSEYRPESPVASVFGGRTHAGYQPIIQTLPDGVNLQGTFVVVGPKRKYVRITTAPTFTTIGQVTQFNFSGSGAQGTGGMGGMGGGMGGMGGGMGGMGGGMGGMGGGMNQGMGGMGMGGGMNQGMGGMGMGGGMNQGMGGRGMGGGMF